ncbi:MAG: ribokinase [Clostridia bacterium]|nr:ribokinase [Clostridia bacterium]MBN2883714.1 ribokinase [Clostridia bacterium]
MKKLTVFGSFFEDLCGKGPYLPKPGETLIGTEFTYGPGGKGSNQAVAAHRAGADVMMITKIGKDPYGKLVLDFYDNEGIDRSHVFIDENKATGIALILVDENTGENLILVAPGACHNIKTEDVQSIQDMIKNSDMLMVQMEVNMDATFLAMEIANESGVPIIMNPAPAQKIDDKYYRMIDYITPNEIEAEILTGIKTDSEENIKAAAENLFKKGVRNVIITLGKQGVYIKNSIMNGKVPAYNVKTVDTTGAGDAFNGCFAAGLLEGMTIDEAADFANAGAALSVTKPGTAPSMPYRKEIDKFLK